MKVSKNYLKKLILEEIQKIKKDSALGVKYLMAYADESNYRYISNVLAKAFNKSPEDFNRIILNALAQDIFKDNSSTKKHNTQDTATKTSLAPVSTNQL